jgi:tripartite-type tricarboxylate transporter receptor subunit TctC
MPAKFSGKDGARKAKAVVRERTRPGSFVASLRQSYGQKLGGLIVLYELAKRARNALLAAAFLVPIAAWAQTYPDRPIRVVVPFSGGSASDVVTRLVLDRMAPIIGQQFIVENQAGAGGNIGTAAIARAEANGYNLLMSASGPLAVNTTLTKNLPYDPVQAFEPITMLASLPNLVVVNKGLPVASLAELIAYARARPDQLTYSSVGVGSSQHLAGLLFEQLTDTKMRHLPYRVTAQLIADLMTGVVPLSFQNITNVLGQVRAGELKALAIAAKTRSPALPEVPTAAEAGLPEFESSAWFALLAPRGTPKPIVAKLHHVAVTALEDPALRARLVEIGAEPSAMSPAELLAYISAEILKWREVVNRGGVATEP